MRTSVALLALAASAVSAAVHQGFNYGAANSDGSIRDQQRFQDEFNVAKNLDGTDGRFNSARLYTMIQGGTAQDPISAIPAAIASDTTLLLGIWCSAGQDIVNNEIAALKNAINQYGTAFTSRVTGLSVGSEDLYRISPTGVAANSGYGAEPDVLVKYIKQVRAALVGTPLEGVAIGHVDTWNDWVNGANKAVIDAVDWIGVDAYPYFQTSMDNGIENGPQLFFDAYDATVGAAGGKDVWITETGWPVSGPDAGKAQANAKSAEYFWKHVACPSLGKINTYWYTLQDSFPGVPSPSFGIVGTTLSTTPLFDLTCSADAGTVPPTSGKDVDVDPIPTSSIVSSGGGLTPSQGPGHGGDSGGIGSGSGNVSTTLTPVPTGGVVPTGGAGGGVGGGNATQTGGAGGVGGGSASPTGGAGGVGGGTAGPTGGAGGGGGSASPTGGAGGGNGGNGGGNGGAGGNGGGTGVPPNPTGAPSPGAPNGASVASGAGSLALGAAIMAVVAAF